MDTEYEFYQCERCGASWRVDKAHVCATRRTGSGCAPFWIAFVVTLILFFGSIWLAAAVSNTLP